MSLAEVDAALIRYADTMSLNQLSFKIEGILTPEQCGARLSQLLDAPDWLSQTQQDQLVTMKMRQIIVELEDMPRTTRNAEIILNGLEKLGARLEKRSAATDAELHTLYAFQGAALLDAVTAIMNYIKEQIEAGAVWDEHLTAKGMRYAQIEVAKNEM